MDTTKGFTVGKWVSPRGVAHDNYQCDQCQFSTLSLEKMREHQFHEDHRWPFPEGMSHNGPIQGGNA
jgi:hypothetical protein